MNEHKDMKMSPFFPVTCDLEKKEKKKKSADHNAVCGQCVHYNMHDHD